MFKSCTTNVGRWFAYFVKHAPRVPFIIIGKDTHGHLVYLKTGPNPHYNSNTSKGIANELHCLKLAHLL